MSPPKSHAVTVGLFRGVWTNTVALGFIRGAMLGVKVCVLPARVAWVRYEGWKLQCGLSLALLASFCHELLPLLCHPAVEPATGTDMSVNWELNKPFLC